MTTSRPALRKYHCSGSEIVAVSDAPADRDPEFAYMVRIFREHTAVVVASDAKGASEAFRKLTRGVWPDHIDMALVVGHCEGCLRPIMDGERYSADPEGVSVCSDCCGPEGD